MINITQPDYDKYRFWIRDARTRKKWKEIEFAMQNDEVSLKPDKAVVS